MGTLINLGTILLGSSLGLLIRSRLPERYVGILFQALGLFTIFLGVKLALQTREMLVMVMSLALGAVLGEAGRLERRVDRLGEWIKARVGQKSGRFGEGLATAFLLFGIGPMATLGPMQEGLGQGMELLLTKALLDGIASTALAAAFGAGVIFSVIPVGIYQGSITIFALGLKPWLTDPVIDELSAVGGVTLIGLGINLLEISKLRVMNLLPALVVAVLLSWWLSG
jgi:uncharacterized protein